MCCYDGGCYLCDGDKGKFQCSLPNGIIVHSALIGCHICNGCISELIESQTFRHRVINQRRLGQIWALHCCKDGNENDYGGDPWCPPCNWCKKKRLPNYKYCREGGNHYIQVGRYGLFAKDNPV